jgi:hypothetical protein
MIAPLVSIFDLACRILALPPDYLNEVLKNSLNRDTPSAFASYSPPVLPIAP